MTPRQAITWAEVIMTLGLWGFYISGVLELADLQAPTPADVLWPTWPYLIMLVGALALTRGCVFVIARSPRLSQRGCSDYPNSPLLWDTYIFGITLREAIAVLTGRRKDARPYATETEAGRWRAARLPGLKALLASMALVALAAGVWTIALGRSLWSDRAGQVVLIVTAACLCGLVNFLVHRTLFLWRSRSAD